MEDEEQKIIDEFFRFFEKHGNFGSPHFIKDEKVLKELFTLSKKVYDLNRDFIIEEKLDVLNPDFLSIRKLNHPHGRRSTKSNRRGF